MLAYFMRFLMPRSSCTTCIYICKFKKCNIPNMTLLLIVSKIYMEKFLKIIYKYNCVIRKLVSSLGQIKINLQLENFYT